METQQFVKLYKENTRLSSKKVPRKMNARALSLKAWERGKDVLTLEEYNRVSESYGIEQNDARPTYLDDRSSSQNGSTGFPAFLFSNEALPYILKLEFDRDETLLLRLIARYHPSKDWRIRSEFEARNLLNEIPSELLPEDSLNLMMDIRRKLWPVHPSGTYIWHENMSLQRCVMNLIRSADAGQTRRGFSIQDVSDQELIWLAEELDIDDPYEWEYVLPCLNHYGRTMSDRPCSIISALEKIDQGSAKICCIDREAEGLFRVHMSADWKGVIFPSLGSGYKSISSLRKKGLARISSSWVKYTYCRDGSCVAYMTAKGRQLLEYYEGHKDMFKDCDERNDIYHSPEWHNRAYGVEGDNDAEGNSDHEMLLGEELVDVEIDDDEDYDVDEDLDDDEVLDDDECLYGFLYDCISSLQ